MHKMRSITALECVSSSSAFSAPAAAAGLNHISTWYTNVSQRTSQCHPQLGISAVQHLNEIFHTANNELLPLRWPSKPQLAIQYIKWASKHATDSHHISDVNKTSTLKTKAKTREHKTKTKQHKTKTELKNQTV